jgi:hypothetical protein
VPAFFLLLFDPASIEDHVPRAHFNRHLNLGGGPLKIRRAEAPLASR